MTTLTVAIPAYREEERLPPSLAKIAAFRDAHPEWAVDVIVADDGSPDRTGTRAEEAARTLLLPLRVLRLDRNLGKGAAVRAAALAAEGDFVLVSDADLSTPVEEVAKLLATGADVAIGSRAVDESLVKVPQPFARRAAGKLFNRVVRLLAVPGIHDTQCGFKLFTREAARAVFSRASVDRFAWDVEALLLARRLGFTIAEVPVLWFNSEDTRVGLGGGAQAYLDLFRIRWTVEQALRDHPPSPPSRAERG